MAADEGTDGLRDGEGEQDMVARSLPLPLCVQPLLTLVVLTPLTMPVATAAGNAVPRAAVFTLGHGRALALGPALEESVEDLLVCWGHALPRALQILGAVREEDLGDDPPLRGPPSRGR